MGNKENILKILAQESLTSEEIASKIGLTENEVRVYLNRLKKLNKISVIDKKERYKVFAIIKPIDSKHLGEIQELKYLLSQFFNLIKFKYEKKKNIIHSEEDQQLIKKVKAIIEKNDLLPEKNKKNKTPGST